MTWRVAAALNTLLYQLNSIAPGRSKVSDGSIGDAAHATRDSDHNPWYVVNGIGVVTARDFTHDPAAGLDCQRLAESLRSGRDPRVKYVIWNNRIMSGGPGPSPWTWRPYSGVNPHTKHLHLSVNANTTCDDTRTFYLGTLTSEDDMTPDQDLMLRQVHEQLTKPWPSYLDGRKGFTLVDYARNADVSLNAVKISLAGLSDDEVKIVTEVRQGNTTQTATLLAEFAKTAGGGADPAAVATSLAAILGPELGHRVIDALREQLSK